MSGELHITIIGRLTTDPELRFTPSGSAVANFTIAQNPRIFDRQSNEWKDGETNFFRCSIWREAAENVAESLTKGMPVIAFGEIKTKKYQTKEGENRSSQEVELSSIGPDLRWGSAKFAKVARGGGQQGAGGGGGNWGGQQGGGGFGGGQQAGQGQQGGGFGGWGPAHEQGAQPAGQPAAQSDPWATPGVSNTGGGWGSGPDSEPPF
jgi:single-strand DNA-binding protein